MHRDRDPVNSAGTGGRQGAQQVKIERADGMVFVAALRDPVAYLPYLAARKLD